MQPSQSTEINVATLIEVRVPGQPRLRLQNYQPGIYIYGGAAFEFAAFTATGMTSQLELTGSTLNATIGNSSQYDAMVPIRDMLKAADGWRSAIVVITQMWPDAPNDPPRVARTQVLSSEINDSISFNLRSPLEAINAKIPGIYFTNQTFPGLPFAGVGGT